MGRYKYTVKEGDPELVQDTLDSIKEPITCTDLEKLFKAKNLRAIASLKIPLEEGSGFYLYVSGKNNREPHATVEMEYERSFTI